MNDEGDSLNSPSEQPGYRQFYVNDEAAATWSRRQLEAGNRLIGLGLAGFLLLIATGSMIGALL